MTNMTGSKLSICSHPGKITGYWITTISFPYRGPYWSTPIWASTLSQANIGVSFLDVGSTMYVINSLIHGHFHIGLVIIPRPILARDAVESQYGGLVMITRPIWKYPCINL